MRQGGVPPGLMGVGFKMLRPTNDIAALSGLWLNLDRRDYILSYKAMHHWANDFVGMPGRFFSQLAKGLYGQNKLLKGEFRVKGRRVDLRNIHQPLLAIAASHDNIVPPLAARQAHAVMWPKLDAWVTERTTALRATTALHAS
jgi:polyhydroxyalkanoate synthase